MSLPTPHGDKLVALLQNDKLPATDHDRVQQAVIRYQDWLARIARVEGDEKSIVGALVDLLNEYPSLS